MINVTETELSNEIAKAFQVAGQKLVSADINFMSRYLVTEAFPNLKNIQWHEIKSAISVGITGEYGEYHGINAKSIMKFIRSYMESDAKREYDRNKVKALPYGEKSQDEIDYLNKQAVKLMLHQNIKEPKGKWFNGNSIVLYDYFVRKGIIRDEYRNFLDEAKNSVLGGYKDNIKGADRNMSQEIRNKMQELNKNGNTDQMALAKVLCMQNIDLLELEEKLNY